MIFPYAVGFHGSGCRKAIRAFLLLLLVAAFLFIGSSPPIAHFKIEFSKQPEILWLAGPETEAQVGWELKAPYSLVQGGEHARMILFAKI